MSRRWGSAGVACLLAATVAGCATQPSNYALALSKDDPKWSSPQCQEMRAKAAAYKEESPIPWAAGLLFPYGTAIVATAKEQQAKKRQKFARDMHMRCSSQPLPKSLEANPNAL